MRARCRATQRLPLPLAIRHRDRRTLPAIPPEQADACAGRWIPARPTYRAGGRALLPRSWPVNRVRVVADRAAPARHPRSVMVPEAIRRIGADCVDGAGLGFLRPLGIEHLACLQAGTDDGDMAGLFGVGVLE